MSDILLLLPILVQFSAWDPTTVWIVWHIRFIRLVAPHQWTSCQDEAMVVELELHTLPPSHPLESEI